MQGNACGKRLYLQLKSGDSYLYQRKDGTEVFTVKNDRLVDYWQQQEYPVMLVIRTSDGIIRWMDGRDYLRRNRGNKRIIFAGENFTALNVSGMRDRVLAQHSSLRR